MAQSLVPYLLVADRGAFTLCSKALETSSHVVRNPTAIALPSSLSIVPFSFLLPPSPFMSPHSLELLPFLLLQSSHKWGYPLLSQLTISSQGPERFGWGVLLVFSTCGAEWATHARAYRAVYQWRMTYTVNGAVNATQNSSKWENQIKSKKLNHRHLSSMRASKRWLLVLSLLITFFHNLPPPTLTPTSDTSHSAERCLGMLS